MCKNKRKKNLKKNKNPEGLEVFCRIEYKRHDIVKIFPKSKPKAVEEYDIIKIIPNHSAAVLIWKRLPKMQIINLLFLLWSINFNKFTCFLREMQYRILLPDFALHAGSVSSVFYSICELLKEIFCLICCQALCESAAVLLLQLLKTWIMSPWISRIHYFRCMCEQDTGFSSVSQGSTTCRERKTSWQPPELREHLQVMTSNQLHSAKGLNSFYRLLGGLFFY